MTFDIFEHAKSALRKGWTKGIRHDSVGRVCLLGAFEPKDSVEDYYPKNDAESYPEELEAVAECIHERPTFQERLSDVDTYNCVSLPINSCVVTQIAAFNNHPDTVLEDVLSVVECAEKKCKAAVAA